MNSTYGDNLKLTIFGQSHGPAIGMTLDGIPAGLPVNSEVLQSFLNRRAPGQNAWSTPRKEKDKVEILSGIVDGKTCSAPITAVIQNTNTHSIDYDNLQNCPRPGHADYTAQVKYGGSQDAAGGGHFSGRLTAPLCIAGGMCLQWLENIGVHISAHIADIHGIKDNRFDPLNPDLNAVSDIFPVLNDKQGEEMRASIYAAKANGDSVGGSIECAVCGLEAGYGGPLFAGLEGKLAQILYGIPAVKGVEFGAGFGVCKLYGSENNDAFAVDDGRIVTTTNHCGGILGGISNGMPILFRVAFKPTPSIAKSQQTVDLSQMQNTTVQVKGRHDPCIVPRAVPVVEAAAAIAIFDTILGGK